MNVLQRQFLDISVKVEAEFEMQSGKKGGRMQGETGRWK